MDALEELVIAVDPGKMCGIFAATIQGDVALSRELPPCETADVVERALIMHCGYRIVSLTVERFTLQSVKMTRQDDALEVIGMLRYLAWKYGVALTVQSRSERVKVGSNVFVRLNWNVSTPEGHVRAAAQHCFVSLTSRRPSCAAVRRGLGTID